MYVDARNRLWIGTENAGLVRMSADRRQLHFFDRGSRPLLASNTIWSIAGTPDGAIWFGTHEGGLYRLDANDRLQRFLPEAGNPRSLPAASVPYLATQPDGTLWLGTKHGLARWTGADFDREPSEHLPGQLINGLTTDADGSLWINTYRGAVVRHADGRFGAPDWALPAGEQILGMMLRDEQGGYWLDTRSGLGRGANGQYRTVPLYSAVARGLVRPNWTGAYEDREGGIWLASTNAGLWHLLPRWWQFAVFSRLEDDNSSLRNGYVLGTSPSRNGGVWTVGSHGALDRFDPATGDIQQYRTWVNGNHWLTSVREDRNGRVWIGSIDALLRYDPRTDELRRWDTDAATDAAQDGAAEAMALCDGGLLWVMSPAGLQQRDLDGHVLHQLDNGEAGLQAGQLNLDLACGPQDHLWVASSRGLLPWLPEQARFLPVTGAPTSAVHAMHIGTDGDVWLSEDGRLSRYRWALGQLQREAVIGAERGYPAIAANGLVVDHDGVAWATSPRGLLRVSADDQNVRLYGVHDGLPSQEFREHTLMASASGRLVAGTPSGVVVFDPALVRPSTRRAPLVIERVEVRRGEQVLDLTHDSPLEIADGDRDLRIVARLLSFADSASNVYRYRLAGYDPDWVEVGPAGERLFSRLPPGSYRMEVQARSADQVWSRVQTLEFSVRPPWWRSLSGLLVLVSLALLLTSWFAWLYRRRLQRRHAYQLALHNQELAEQASAAKTRFLANLGYEIRTPMTGVMGMSELLLASPLDAQQRGYTQSIRHAGQHLLHLVNDALDLARIESRRLELQSRPFALVGLLQDLAALMGPLAAAKGLRFTLDDQLPPGLQAMGDAMRVRQILLNLLSNAVKFTSRGSITLHARVLDAERGLHFDVRDTGPGISQEQQQRLFRRFEQADGARTAAQYGGSGLGLAICRELSMAMQGHIQVQSQMGSGTTFTVALPLALSLEAAQPSAEGGAGELPQAPPLPPQQVLLVEDDATVADVVSALLTARGHQVVHAGHALAALREISSGPFDVGLLDLDLPGLSGFELAQHLRNHGYTLPLLTVTARTDADLQQQVEAVGINGFLRKPVTGELLVAAIAQVLGR
ncbi:MAG: Aerobic respiration control sensor protein ArcB [Stenotrophomonas maltophilia]|uniref:histidine kinase n=1 Tax=Stenotrophomonas maltophilia TaxID=40324 RepID=A0A7V8JMG6_STEMA|nr:MAG: Aerobic respiration control sensor protein ArcB [Stenotrophomonas maltophilia]